WDHSPAAAACAPTTNAPLPNRAEPHTSAQTTFAPRHSFGCACSRVRERSWRPRWPTLPRIAPALNMGLHLPACRAGINLARAAELLPGPWDCPASLLPARAPRARTLPCGSTPGRVDAPRLSALASAAATP